ncbi:MAG: EAL domain-containing protein [Curvibacter lanceolatus]|uniref:putative bifunctional diguanylate cyclase/phosphodiesterase n=1 Tax=Curvibacter lanceolatus TaxID=86182 RepID=UPI00035E56D9|nr:EAL domain-containing protein [Curvibacter lanceolatus]MBV5291945.1 EAL domain-containing protein [Curvibacter lanceolatus]
MDRNTLIDRLFRRLETLPRQHIWLLGVGLSVLMVELLVAPIGYLIKGRVPPDYLFTGLVTAVLVASVVLWLADRVLQRAARQNLRKQLRMQHLIFETTPLGVLTLNAQLQVTRINPAALQRMQPLGLSMQSALADWWHPDDLPTVRRHLQQLSTESGRLILQNQRITGPTGRVIWVDLALSSLVRSSGEGEGVLLILTDVSQRHEAEQAIQKLAYFDALTGLPNRRLMQDRLQQALASRQQGEGHAHGAVIFIDLDNFKTINDTLGHQVGDRFLQTVAEALGRCLRQGDTLARLGGDEFVVILPELDASPAVAALDTARVAKKILAQLEQVLGQAYPGFPTSASLGVVLFRPGGPDCDELLRRADIAMYQAKAAGRNTFRFFEEAMQNEVNQRAALETELRQALPGQQLFCLYQLQAREVGGLCGAELLLRWRHPQAGVLLPEQFIGLAEQSQQIQAIGQWVLEQACGQLALWRGQPLLQDLSLSVNVSPVQFAQADFVSQVLQAVERHQVPPGRLCLEITESLILQDLESCARKLAQLRAHEVRLGVDHFGAGHSSAADLSRLPLHQLKLSRRIVQGLPDDRQAIVVVKTLIDTAHNLGLEPVAVGVETEAQREQLLALGCSTFQGHALGQPVPVDELAQQLMVRQLAAD